MALWSKLGKAIKFVPTKIDAKIEEEIADKTAVAVLAALKQLDGSLPILTTLLAGGTVKAEVTVRLIDTDGASVTGDTR